MKIIYFLLFGLLFISFGQAQKHSSFKFNPPFEPDSLQIVNIDSLKFDLNFIILKGEIEDIFITGKLGFKKNVFETNTTYLDYFKNDSIKTVSLTGIYAGRLNMMDYKVRYNRRFYFKDASYSLDKLKEFIANTNFARFDFDFDNVLFRCKKIIPKQFHDSPNFKMVDCHYKKQWLFKFSKLDLQNINVYDEKGLSKTIPYILLKSQ